MWNQSFKIIITIILINIPFDINAREEPIRVACVGNSITFGYTIPNRELNSYPAQLNNLLGSGYDVRNFGVSSRTMLKKGDYPYWNEPAFANALNFNPDTVIILLGGNDTKPHNWQYKDEYIPDYIAMIDTFKQLESNPDIWICYPSPAFKGWARADSIYIVDIIPMIDQIRTQRNVNLIDLHAPMVDKDDYFPDGVHPSIEGAGYMAKIVYQSLTGFELSTVRDENVALNASVVASGFQNDSTGFNPPGNITDDDAKTKWVYKGMPCWAIVNLNSVQTIDMFQLGFSENTGHGYQYTIDVSMDSVAWITTVDQSARSDTSSALSIDNINPVDAKYVKLTISGASNYNGDWVEISDFRVLKYTEAVHAPYISSKIIRESSSLLGLEIYANPTTQNEEAIAIYHKKPKDEDFKAVTGYRAIGQNKIRLNFRKADLNLIYASAFKDGKEVNSDTVQFGHTGTHIGSNVNDFNLPQHIKLYDNFPNPFNPATQITFSNSKNQHIRLMIYDILGKEVEILVDEKQNKGTYKVQFDATHLSSGIYFYRLEAGDHMLTKKMLFAK